ncbi:glycosyltransferase [Iningainema tapete]|uniref:Glycosyltransferase family 4 protein n=1 Tax=Iningainema tapete BLCC-T55 TaxID=2748662 RepID=A0A8J6XJL3_9CYAN|nr:glycosyltransferase [Iningainema tapete]MBD2771532.1 glycosyltransferase family 4 protein [Iningainema tapete BLCC-T55]
MRILMVAPGGIAMIRPLKWALEEGHEVWLLTPHNPLLPQETPKNYRYLPFTLELVNYHELTGELPKDEITHQYLIQTAAAQIKAIIKQFQPDVIHTNGLFFGTECCIYADVHPLICSAWGGLNFLLESKSEEVLNQNMTKVAFTAFRNSDVLIVEAPGLVDKCKPWVSQHQRVELIHLGTKTHRFRPQEAKYIEQWRRALNVPEGGKVLLSPRGWSKIYNHHQILEAYAKAYPYFEKPTVVVFLKYRRTNNLQEVQEYYKYFYTKAKEFGVEQNIRWLPPLPHQMMPAAYSVADLVINYPITDAFPSSLVETLACERKAVTNLLPAYENTFVEKFCTTVESQNPAALAEALIAEVNSSSAEQEKLLAQGRQFIIENYDDQIYKKKLLKIYEDTAASNLKMYCSTRTPKI